MQAGLCGLERGGLQQQLPAQVCVHSLQFGGARRFQVGMVGQFWMFGVCLASHCLSSSCDNQNGASPCGEYYLCRGLLKDLDELCNSYEQL